MPAGRAVTSNIAAVEPYIKHIPTKEIIQDEKGFALNKHDPKYKTLPYNIKLLGMDGKSEVNDLKPQDEVGKGYLKVDTAVSKNSPDAPSPVSKPSAADLLPKETIHNTSHFTPSLGHTTAYQAMEDTLKQSAQDGSSIVPTAKNIFGVDYKAPISLSNLAPRPYGTTFSTSMISGRPSIITTVPQSSPGLSTTSQSPGSFPKTSTPVSGNSGSRTNNNNDMKEIFITGAPVSMPSRTPPAYSLASSQMAVSTKAGVAPKSSGPIYQIASSRPQPLMQPQRTQDPPSPSSTASSGSVSSTQPRSTSQVGVNQASDSKGVNLPPYTLAPSSGNSFPPQYKKPTSAKSDISEGGFSKGSQNVQNSGTSNRVLISGDVSQSRADTVDSAKPVDQSQSSPSGKTEASTSSVSSALSVLKSGTTSTAPSSRPTYRYAPKSVIANTYMKKLGSSTLDQYRQNMNKLYKDFNNPSQQGSGSEEKGTGSGGKLSQSGHPPGSPTATVHPINAAPEAELDNKSGEKEHEGVKPPIFLRGPPPYPGAPPYNIDPVHYRPNAPKTLRRRLSSGDSDDLAHKVQQKLAQKSPSEENNDEDNVFEIAHHKQPDIGLGGHQPDIIRMDSIQDSYNNNYGNDPVQNPPSPKEQPSVKDADRSHLPMVLRRIKGIVKTKNSVKSTRRVSFDPLALLLDASLEGELELVQRTAKEVSDPSAPNDEGITALHNAICAGHYEIVKFLVEFGCNVNAPDSDGWTPLHCAASCNNLPMVKFLVEHGACIFATTISDHETAAEKCEEDEDGYDGCSEYLYSVQEKLGIMNKGIVFAVFDYAAQHHDELTFKDGNSLTVLRKGDENEKDWWWAKTGDLEGYIPRNLLGLYPRVVPQFMKEQPSVARSPQS
jgi:apoptosis-stimulating of p53 protein 1